MNNDITDEEARMIATELDHRSRQLAQENPELAMRYRALADRFADGGHGFVLTPRRGVARRKVRP